MRSSAADGVWRLGVVLFCFQSVLDASQRKEKVNNRMLPTLIPRIRSQSGAVVSAVGREQKEKCALGWLMFALVQRLQTANFLVLMVSLFVSVQRRKVLTCSLSGLSLSECDCLSAGGRSGGIVSRVRNRQSAPNRPMEDVERR